MAARSRESIAKKELVQFRLDADKIVDLYEIAADKGMLMGTMLRQWVIERMDDEQAVVRKHTDEPAVKESRSNRNISNLADEVTKLTRQLSTLKTRLDKIENPARNKRRTNAN
jgi:hypothetical protein